MREQDWNPIETIPEDEHVLTYGIQDFGLFKAKVYRLVKSSDSRQLEGVTHWQKLEPPKE